METFERLTCPDPIARAWCGPLRPWVPKKKAFSRLVFYEDTGLAPEEITTEKPACVFYCNRKCNLDGDWCPEGPGCPKEVDSETAMRLLIPPSNAPLTLEELWQMDGEPVWLLPIQFGVPYGYWGIITEISDDGVRLATKENPYDFGASSLYGVTWIAYRHKLEDEQNVPKLGTEEE